MVEADAGQLDQWVRQFFVGRNTALKLFYQIVNGCVESKRGIYFYGRGGIGKTWILRKIVLDNRDGSLLFAPRLIDFSDTQNHSVRGLQTTIRERLQSPESFEAYDEALKQLKGVDSNGRQIHPGAVASLEARANKTFIECCQRAVDKQSVKIVLLFDTFEHAQKIEVGRWFREDFLPSVDSLLVAIVGRPDPEPAQMPGDILSQSLTGFDLKDVQTYFREFGPTLSATDVETIWQRTQGAPLFVNLIRDLILGLNTQKREEFLVELGNLEEGTLVQDSHKIKYALVGQFAEQNDQNKVLWAMAYLWRRFDLDMLKYVAEHMGWLTLTNFERIFDQLKQSIYIKEFPEQQNHLLHDEIRDMIRQYLLVGANDPWMKMRDSLYESVIGSYYPDAVKHANDDLARQYEAERLGYLLDRDPDAGLSQYKVYRSDMSSGHYDFEELLWGEVREHLQHFEDGGYSICCERGEWLRKRSLFHRAEGHYRQMVDRFESGRLSNLQWQGSMALRQGETNRARDAFERGLELTERDDWANIAMIHANLGQLNQYIGDWDEALHHYRLSADAAIQAGNYGPLRLASAYINRSYIYALTGQYTDATTECERAIDLLNGLPVDTPGRALSLIYAKLNLGTAKRHSDDFAGAARNYREALTNARDEKDGDAIRKVLGHLGVNQILWGRWFRRRRQNCRRACTCDWEGLKYLTRSIEMAHQSGLRVPIADNLNRLGKGYREVDRLQRLFEESPKLREADGVEDAWEKLQKTARAYHMPFEVEYEHDLLMPGTFADLNWLDKAARLFEVSALIADETNQFHRALDSLIELASVLVDVSNPKLEGLERRISIVIGRIEHVKGYEYQQELFSAAMDTIRADLAFRLGKLDDALGMYKTAYVQLAKQRGYAEYLLKDRLRTLRRNVLTLPSQQALEWWDALNSSWSEQSLFRERPDALRFLEDLKIEIRRNFQQMPAQVSPYREEDYE